MALLLLYHTHPIILPIMCVFLLRCFQDGSAPGTLQDLLASYGAETVTAMLHHSCFASADGEPTLFQSCLAASVDCVSGVPSGVLLLAESQAQADVDDSTDVDA